MFDYFVFDLCFWISLLFCFYIIKIIVVFWIQLLFAIFILPEFYFFFKFSYFFLNSSVFHHFCVVVQSFIIPVCNIISFWDDHLMLFSTSDNVQIIPTSFSFWTSFRKFFYLFLFFITIYWCFFLLFYILIYLLHILLFPHKRLFISFPSFKVFHLKFNIASSTLQFNMLFTILFIKCCFRYSY